MKKIPKNFPNLLQQAVYFIFDSGVSVAAFCRKCELSPSLFYQWRRGERKISYKTAKRINDYLSMFSYNLNYLA